MNVILSDFKKGASVTHSWVNFHSRMLHGQKRAVISKESNSSFYLPASHLIQNQNYSSVWPWILLGANLSYLKRCVNVSWLTPPVIEVKQCSTPIKLANLVILLVLLVGIKSPTVIMFLHCKASGIVFPTPAQSSGGLSLWQVEWAEPALQFVLGKLRLGLVLQLEMTPNPGTTLVGYEQYWAMGWGRRKSEK